MVSNRNKLLIRLGDRKRRQNAAIELLLIDFCAPDDPILSIDFLPDGEEQISIKIKNSSATEDRKINIEKLVTCAQNEDSLVSFALGNLLSFNETYKSSKETIANTNAYDSIKILCEDSVTTPISEKVGERLEAGVSVRLIGESASGKTVSTAQVVCRLKQLGWTFSWVDLSEPGQSMYSLILSLIRNQRQSAGKHVVVVDDSQANPTGLKNIGRTIDELNKYIETELLLVVIGWESAIDNIKQYFPYTSQINCYGDLAIPSLVDEIFDSEIPAKDLEIIRESCGGDLFIARLLAEYKLENKCFPSQKQIATLAYRKGTNGHELDDKAIELLYVLSSLSQFEIDTYKDYAITYDNTSFTYLLKIKCIRSNNNYLSVGHRTLAKLLILYLQDVKKNIIYRLPKSTQIAVKYLKTASPSQIVATLERLDVAGLAYSKTDQHGATFLARAWESLTILVNYVSRETATDPTWRNNTGSAVFAAIALISIGNQEYINILKHLYNKWNIDGVNDLPTPNDPIPTEHFDFLEIKKTMEKEESNIGKTFKNEDKAENIDFSRMHYTWVLGLLLGVAGYKPSNNMEVEEKLLNLAKRAQNPDGSFYPARVPWVTARVLIGLASVGESIRSSNVVKNACEWLCRSYPTGPYKFGTWEPGTGAWNTILETTAMCVNALIRCGVPSTDSHVKAGISYLKGKKSVWAMQGKEIDGAFAVETILAVEGIWRNVDTELNMLLSWIQQRGAWEGNVVEFSNESHDQSCKISQISSSLIRIVWDTVRRELPLLLEGLSVSKYSMLTDDIDESIKDVYGHLIEQTEELKRKIDGEIRDRISIREQDGMSMPEIHKNQKKWEERKRKLRDIENLMHNLSDQRDFISKENMTEVTLEINTLGKQCFQNTWKKIKLN